MQTSPTRGGSLASALLSLILLAAGLHCSKGSKAATVAPSSLSYQAAPVSGVVGEALAALTPTVTGSSATWSVSPDLPAGLTLSTSTGAITGTPTAVSAQTTYTVTAENTAGSTTATVQILVLAATPNIYVGGYQDSTSGEQQLTLWTNGTATLLSDGTDNVTGGYVAASESNLYVIGNTSNGLLQLPNLGQLWQNNGLSTFTASNLVSSTSPTQLNAIAASGTTTYVVGTLGSSPTVATLWTSGNPTPLDTSGDWSCANAIFLSGTDVYVAGFVGTTPTYWKNGSPTPLPLPANAVYGAATGIAVAGTNVFVSGTATQASNYNGIAMAWVNGTQAVLGTGSLGSYGNAITTDGKDIYVAGSNGDSAMLWSGQDATSLASAGNAEVLNTNGNATAVALYGSDVYVAGMVSTSTANDAPTSVTLWKNGTATTWGTPTAGLTVNALVVTAN